MENPITYEEFKAMMQASGQLETKSYMTIPMAVHKMPISIGAKYLYGILYGFVRNGVIFCSNEWLMEQLQCKDIKTLRKWFKELQTSGAIVMTYDKNNHRQIECKISETITLMSDKELQQQYEAYTNKLNAQPEFVRTFVKSIK